jgi:hypothetical protein
MTKKKTASAWSDLVKKLAAYIRSLEGGKNRDVTAKKLLDAMTRFEEEEGLKKPEKG